MRILASLLPLLTTTALSLSFSACSSDDSGKETNESKTDGGDGTGGKAGGSGGAKSAGGAGTGGAAVQCDAETGDDACKICLAGTCCDALKGCNADSNCTTALATHEKCFGTPGMEVSTCFGDFVRELQGDAAAGGALGPVPTCIATTCQAACGGPGVL